jgi:hypothetical protein
MISVNQIKNQLASYLAREIPFAEFEDWLIDQSWNMHKDSSDEAQELVNEINASIYDYLDQRISEDYLRTNLQPHLRTYSVVITNVTTRPVYRPGTSASRVESRRLAYG